MKTLRIKKVSVLFVFIFATYGAYAMALSDFGKVCLFSKMSGVITLDGKPAAHARLVRTANRDGDITDETTTDDKGYFEFPAMFERTITKYLPQEFVASQKVIAHYENKEYEIWWGVKRKPEENIEARGAQLIVSCDLTNEEKGTLIGESSFHSLCSWNVESDKPTNWEEGDIFDSDVEQKNHSLKP